MGARGQEMVAPIMPPALLAYIVLARSCKCAYSLRAMSSDVKAWIYACEDRRQSMAPDTKLLLHAKT